MKKFFVFILVLCFVFTSCSLFPVKCNNFKESEESWGTQYSWSSMGTEGQNFTTYYYIDSNSPLFGKSYFAIHKYKDLGSKDYVETVQENPTVSIERSGGVIKSITINGKMYINKNIK